MDEHVDNPRYHNDRLHVDECNFVGVTYLGVEPCEGRSSWSTSKQIWEVEMERVPLTSSSGQTSRAGLLSTTGPETHELGSDGAPVRGGIMMI